MKTKEEYIQSGLLELYVAGTLSEKENQEVYEAMQHYPEVLQEVVEIEAAMLKLTAATNPRAVDSFDTLKTRLHVETKVVSLDKPRHNWFTYAGWAAAIIFGTGLLWLFNTNKDLETQIQTADIKQGVLEAEIEAVRGNLKEMNAFIDVIRDREIITVPLEGQTVSPSSYAQAYWDKKTNKVYLDAKGLPEPPEGKVYQFWSLTLNPLTPTDMGIIKNFSEDTNKVFVIDNPNQSEAFGITLEPEGGSSSPTLEQLYTLGVVKKSS